MADAKIPIKSITKDMTLNIEVVGYRGWLVRLKIALFLISLAARVAGVGIKFNGLNNGDD